MKTIKSTVTYKVPHWNYCNEDKFDMDATPSKRVCQFCIKERGGYRCALYDDALMSNGTRIQKLPKCCKATAGYESVIEPAVAPEAPTIKPSELMKATIDLYKNTVNELLKQGYPRQLAEKAAEQSILKSK